MEEEEEEEEKEEKEEEEEEEEEEEDLSEVLARSGVKWLVGVCGFRFSSKIFKLRISFCAQCVCGLSILCGVRRHVCLCGVAGQ